MLNRDFKEFAELLNAMGVEYLVVGGYALVAHGHPRYTGNIELRIRPTAGERASGRLKDLADLESLDGSGGPATEPPP